MDIGLYYSNLSKLDLIGYADAWYLSDPHKARSQIDYLFTYGGTAISWRSVKQTLVATPSNHAEKFSNSWGKSWMYLVKINNSTYSRRIWLSN